MLIEKVLIIAEPMSKLLSLDTESSNEKPFDHNSELVKFKTVPSVNVISTYLRYCTSIP